MMKKIGIAFAALLVLGILFGGEDTSPTPTPAAPAPAPAPAPEPPPAPEPQPEPSGPPMRYGDDEYFDSLWDRCAEDDYDACDELFWDSPVGSDYEDFALDRLMELEFDETPDRDIVDEVGSDTLLQLAWNTLTREDHDLICESGELLGWNWAAEQVVEGAGGLFTVREVADFLRETCR